ncbi:MAG: hypothetical protein AAB906_00125 [Patescibacteria group bacterium]
MFEVRKIADRLSKLKTDEEIATWMFNLLYMIHSPNEDDQGEICSDTIEIKSYDSFSEGLQEVYLCLENAESKDLFRKAIGRALQKCAENEKTIPAIEVLMYLIIRIKAPEALDDLFRLAVNGFIREKEKPYLSTCICVPMSLKPDIRVFEFTRSMIDTAVFKEKHLLTAIKIMAQSQPDREKMYKIIEKLGPRISNLYKKVQLNKEEDLCWKIFNRLYLNMPDIADRVKTYMS